MSKKTPQFEALSPEAKRLYTRLVREWHLVDGAGLITLTIACQALDRLRQAEAIIAKEGIIATDRFGQPKPHPACQIEKESRAGLLHALRAMNLDLESLDEEEDDNAA